MKMNYWFAEEFQDKSNNINISEILENGYTIVKNSVDIVLINEFLGDYEMLKKNTLDNYSHELDSEDYCNGMYRRIVNLHSKLSSARPLFSSNTALTITDYFFGESTSLYTSLFYERGSGQDCHRDTPYFWTNPGYGYFGVWLALEDVEPDAGPLVVIPKNHKIIDTELFRNEIGNMERLENGQLNPLSALLWQEYQSKVMEKCKAGCLKAKEVIINKGDTIIWHPQLMHGGAKIRNNNLSRKSFVMHVTPKYMNVFAQDKYFDASFDSENISRDTSLDYSKHHDRLFRETGVWAIAQKIFLPVQE